MNSMRPKTNLKSIDPKLRFCMGVLFVLLGLGILLSAMSIPFIFESLTLNYKFGLDKTFLRMGKMIGMATGCLLLFQIILSGRLKLLDRIFSINRLLIGHKWNGMFIAALAPIHAILILLSQGNEILDPNIKNWPQFMGVFLLILIWGTVFFSRWRKVVGLSFSRWRFFHGIFTHLAVIAFGVHVFYASDTFEYGLPRKVVLLSLSIYLLIFLWTKIKQVIPGRPYNVLGVSPAARDASSITLCAENRRRFAYSPGQFVFVKFKSEKLSREEHPFTICSSPNNAPEIMLTIRSCGDWTDKARYLRPGDKAFITGPFGLFGNVDLDSDPEVIMIAGGIGITPMLSILGYFAGKKDERPITLLWSNRTQAHIIYPEKFADFRKRLPGFRIVHILTQEPEYNGEKGRLNLSKVERHLSGCDKLSKILICGPPAMMSSAKHSVLSLGFRRRSILMERFDL